MVNLNEYLYKKMDILFLALNAPFNSNKNKHWFSNNLSFWNVLYKAGLIAERINDKFSADEIVFGGQSINYKNLIYGVTDLNRKDVQTDSNNVKVHSNDVKRILDILDENKVGILCIVHSKVFNMFRKVNLINLNTKYGHVGNYQKTKIFNVPFHNASIPNKHNYYGILKKEFY